MDRGAARAISPHIRRVGPTDGSALAALERACPDSGALIVRVAPTIDYLQLVARYPDVSGFVATAPGVPGLAGMVFTSVAPTHVSGVQALGAYVFSLRVHPLARRRGLGVALVARAVAAAMYHQGAEVAWAGILEGNEASRRTFVRAGFTTSRQLAVRVIPAWLARGALPRRSELTARHATLADLPTLAVALNERHAHHELWRPLTPAELHRELTVAGHDLRDVTLLEDSRGELRGMGAVFDLGRVADIRLLGHRRLPAGLNRLVARLARRWPVAPRLLRYRLLPDDPRQLVAALGDTGRARTAALAIPIDPLDPAWEAVARLPGASRPLTVAVCGVAPAVDRPVFFA
jgi:ribosomal protein S18 acetylase RimI-like enzyme